MKACSLFSGIGGFEVGFDQAGIETTLVCDNDPAALAVLKARFPDISREQDIALMRSLPSCDILTAGWPCQDLSQAGKMVGADGRRSGMVRHVFRLIDATRRKPRFIVLENVAFALHLDGGRAIKKVVSELEARNYSWAYRILDTREFGLPQRRRRIFIVATLDESPLPILFDGVGAALDELTPQRVGFYWTEGNRGLGWSPEAIPPLKGGSAFSIPSAPAVWDRNSREFFVPGISDAERLQGLRSGWTSPAEDTPTGARSRWRLVGNAVSVPVTRWLGKRLSSFQSGAIRQVDLPLQKFQRQHNIAWGGPGVKPVQSYLTVEGPRRPKRSLISDFKFRDQRPLSVRAAKGFLERLLDSPLIVDPKFKKDLAMYCKTSVRIANKAA